MLSPNHRFVAYGGEAGAEPIQAMIVDLEAGSAGRLGGVVTDVRWSPDSRRLLVLGFEHWVEVIDATTGETLKHIDDPGVDTLVGWTPDGGSILYRRCEPDAPKDEVVACLDGPPWMVSVDDPSIPAGRYEGPVLPRFGAYSPDGLWIANVEPDGLYVGPSDGSQPQLVFPAENGSDFEEYPTWSPDGEWIAFRRPDAIHVVPRTGGAAQLLPLGYSPAWHPCAKCWNPGGVAN